MPSTTVREILLGAFEDINVHADEDTLGASDARVGMQNINRLMAELDADGISLGFTNVDQLSDVVTIPAGAMNALISLLAFRLWPKYRTPELPSAIIGNAKRAVTILSKLGSSVGEALFPSTLPIGSGNGSCLTSAFYSGNSDSTILTEINGSVSLEDET
jgi:hypothetical protein